MENKKALSKEFSGLKRNLKKLEKHKCDCNNCQNFRTMLSDFKKEQLKEIVVTYLRISQDNNYSKECKKFQTYIG